MKLKYYFELMRFHKPVGIILLLWPTLWAWCLAYQGSKDFKILCIFILGVIIMRAAGCVMNDIADRNLDIFVTRTKERPLAAKKISLKEAILILMVLLMLASSLLLFLNRLVFYLALLGLVFVVVYPFLKRVTHFPQLGLGVAFSWGIPMVFAEKYGYVPSSAWLLFLTALIWPVIYDTQYAMADRHDDLAVGIKSTAILFKDWDNFIIGVLQVFFLTLLMLDGYIFHLTSIYFLSLMVVSVLFIYQQVLTYQKHSLQCFNAFLNHQWVGLVIFLGIFLSVL